MNRRKSYPIYKALEWLVRLFYPKIKVVGQENLPEEPSIIVGNHSQMNGPIAGTLYFPGKHYIWCAGEMMHAKDVPAYAYKDFWSKKPKCTKWFYKLLSYLITPLSVCIFNNANTIGVYHDARVINTFKKTVNVLSEGANVIIFPEHEVPHNNIVCDFQNRFVDVAKMYYKKTGKILSFVPMYLAPKLKTMYLGRPIAYCPENPGKAECARICDYLMAEITEIAYSLPRHTVVPYPNVPKKDYPTNIPEECHEKTDR